MPGFRKRLIGFLAFLAALSLAPAVAQDSGGGQEVRALIQRQLDAFARDDGPGAYALAAPGIKSIFTDSGIFMDMVRNRYTPVYRHRSAEFDVLDLQGDSATQAVTIVDEKGEVWTAVYKLSRQPDGSWLISGCALIKADAKDT